MQKVNKVDAIGRFLTKLRKPSNYNSSLIEEMNKFNLKNFRDDLVGAICEAMGSKFDLSIMIKILANIWVTYTDDEYRHGVFSSLDKFLSDKK